MHKLAVFGNPIAHSLSPQIHEQFAAQFDLSISYEKILAPLDAFKKTVQDFFVQAKALGCNVTVPFKVDAFELVDTLSDRAKRAGAVNTIKCQDGKLFGDNTDGVGFLNDLRAKNISLRGKNILLVGAGGAARGLLPMLISQQLAKLTMVNRDVEKAKSILENLDKKNVAWIETRSVENPGKITENTIVIDATAHFDAVQNLLSSHVLPKDLIFYDLKYGHEAPTPLIQWAHAHGLQAYDGVGMLIEQAAEAFYVWFGLRPDTSKIKLRNLSP